MPDTLSVLSESTGSGGPADSAAAADAHPAARLHAARLAAGYATAGRFAEEHDFNVITYRAHERGDRNFRADVARQYAQALGCNWQWLLLGIGSDGLADSADADPFVQVPLYDLSASAGHGSFVEQEDVSRHLAFRTDWLSSVTDAAPDRLAVLTVAGDSMEPTLHSGDHVLVDLTATSPTRDGVYIVRFEDSFMVKRMAIDPFRRKVSIRSDNPLYPGFEDLEPDAVSVVGRVIWLGRRL